MSTPIGNATAVAGLASRMTSRVARIAQYCGVAGAMAHLVELHHQMTGRAGPRQAKDAAPAILHGDGGVLSSHGTLVLERTR